MKRRLILFAGVLLLAIALTGCYQAALTITADPESGKPSITDGGLLVQFTIMGGGDRATVRFGDGTSEATLDGHLSHLYTQAGVFAVTVISGPLRSTTTVTVLDDPPIVRPPMYNKEVVGLGEFQHFNPHHGYAGCTVGTGQPTIEYGVRDPDGNEADLELSWFAWNRSTGEAEAIYNRDGEYINGTLVPVEMVGWFGGWVGPAPRVPVQIPYAPLAVETENCYPDPPCPPEPEPEEGPCHYTDFTLQVRDRWGAISGTHFTIRVCGGCSSQQ